MSSAHDPMTGLAISTNDANGYPCPKDGTILELIDAMARGGRKGAWCPLCHTVWEELAEVPVEGSHSDADDEADQGSQFDRFGQTSEEP